MRYLNSRNRAILREMVSTDFKVRYQGSVLGYTWSLLKPLFLFAILYLVFTYIIPLGKEVEHYPVYLLIGIVLWNFFTEATMIGASSIVARGDLIRKISIPRYLLVIASSLSAIINLGLSLLAVVVFALFNGVIPTWNWLLIIPIIIELYVFALGVSFILATAYVKFRDITYIWEIFLQAGFYASAIIYPLTLVPEKLHQWFFMNPIVQIIQDARHAIATDTSVTLWSTVQSWMVVVPFIIIAVVALVGWFYFKKQSQYFAEDI
ncbi:MAG TPA: ABC transporter permease [Candidatus Saccharimonadales bacterium]|nr:ABC transporter permease [Candidatus Saccharimonadales bacterium]